MALLPKPANSEDNSETMPDRSAIPAGKYLAHIVKTEEKKVKAPKTGSYISVHVVVIEGEFKGRYVFSNLNIVNPNPVAVEMANKELNSICDACEMTDVEDTDELLQIPMVITVAVKPATAQWPEGNEVTHYEPESEWEGGETPGTEGPATDNADAPEVPWEQ